MAHRFSLPSELELEKLITQLFEKMPNADLSRLSVIESRLLYKAQRKKEKKLNKIPWWVVMVIAGGFATAAWWAGDGLIKAQNTEITDKQSSSNDNISGAESVDEKFEEQPYEDNDSPIIYQRESL